MYLAVWLRREYEDVFLGLAEKKGKKPGQLAREIIEEWVRGMEE